MNILDIFFGYAIVLTPYVLGALVLGLLLAGSARWFLGNPQRWVCFFILTLCVPFIFSGGDGANSGSLLKQLPWAALFLYAGLYVAGVTQGRIHWPKRDLPPLTMLLLLGFILLSVAWSPMISVSAKRAVQVVGVVVVGMMVTAQLRNGWTMRRQLVMPSVAFLLIGLLFTAASPHMALDSDHALRAITSHKNTWGQFSLLTCLLLFFSIMEDQKRRGLYVAAFVLAFTSLVLSRSTTSLVTLVFVIAAVVTLGLWHRGLVGRAVLFMGLSLLGLLALGFTVTHGELPFNWMYETVFRVTDKNQTLTGRTFLWQLMEMEISRHKWLGIGYGGFWMGFEGPSAGVISRLSWGPPSQSHSGYIDVLNEIGIVGMGLLLVMLAAHTARILRIWANGETAFAGFHASLLMAALLVNYAETSLLRTTHLLWIVLCFSVLEVNQHVLRMVEAKRATIEGLQLVKRGVP